jgi:hypothetical protein
MILHDFKKMMFTKNITNMCNWYSVFLEYVATSEDLLSAKSYFSKIGMLQEY